jgi:hypothetical protein
MKKDDLDKKDISAFPEEVWIPTEVEARKASKDS